MFDRVVNTRQSLNDSQNPDVNSQGQIDEDGDSDETGATDVNVNEAPAPEETADEDDSPAVHSATVQHNGKITDVIVRVTTPTGAQNKRLVLPGHMTAKRLAAAIANVAHW